MLCLQKTNQIESDIKYRSNQGWIFSLDWGMCRSQGRVVDKRSHELIQEGCIRVSQRNEGSILRRRKTTNKGKGEWYGSKAQENHMQYCVNNR